MVQNLEEKKFYEKTWFAVVMLLLFAPVGIFLLWRYNHFSKLPRVVWTVVFGLFFMLIFFSDSEEPVEAVEPREVEAEEMKEDDRSREKEEIEKEDNKDENETTKVDEIEIQKEELYMELRSAAYDSATDKITVEADTNFADGIEVSIGLYNSNEEYIVPALITSGIVEDGSLNMSLTHLEDDLGLNFIINGSYTIEASLSNYDNERLLEVYESYDTFNEAYELKSGNVEETDSGFKIEGIRLGEIEIADAYSQAEYDQYVFEQEKDLYSTLDYAQLSKNPNLHSGEMVYYTGEIIQIMEEVDYAVIRLAVTKTSYGYDFNDIVWVEYGSNTDYVDGDIVTVYGMIYGSYSYTSQAGWDITVPAMLADWIE